MSSGRRDLIQTSSEFWEFFNMLEEQPIFAYDTETNGKFDRFQVGLVGMSFAWDKYSCYIPFNHEVDEPQLFWLDVAPYLRRIFENKKIEKICHNAKFDEMVLDCYDIKVAGKGHDTYVMAWMLSEDSSSKGLKQLVERIYGVEMDTYEDVISTTPKKKGIPRDYSFARTRLQEALVYAADDAYWTWKLFHYFKPKLVEEKLWSPYEHVERPFIRVLKNVEAAGILVDQKMIEDADKKLPLIAEEVEAKIYQEAGEVFKIGSGKQLGTILFDKLGIGKNVPTTKTGGYSTSAKTLKTYADRHEIVANVLRRKKIAKTHSTFIVGLKEAVSKDGRIHPSFNGAGTATGRLSCRAPNLQQIEGDEVEEIKIRDFFIPSKGKVFVVADYSQVELRVLAHFSKDKEMTAAFMAGDVDFHEEAARRMFEIPDDQEVSRRQRVIAKTLNFGVGYGRQAQSIAEQLGISVEEGQEFIDSWFRKFSGVDRYKENMLNQVRKDSFVRTLSGKKRRFPQYIWDTWQAKGAERQAFNTKIQGSAADIIKIAMLSLDELFANELAHTKAKIILQVHDELIVECPEEYGEEVLQATKRTMENPLNKKNPLRIPLVVDPKIVTKWGDAK